MTPEPLAHARVSEIDVLCRLTDEQKQRIEKRLGMFVGVKAEPVFRDRLRACLLTKRLADEAAFPRKSEETWRECFARWYGERLEVQP